MAGEPAPPQRMSRAEFLAMERRSGEKHILWDGEVFGMAGARIDHNRVVANIVALLHRGLVGKPCEAFPSDLRVHVPAKDGYVYPDVSVVCGGVVVEDPDTMDVVLNPRVVFEVLSDGTESFDRGDKFDGYKSITSLSDYLIVFHRSRRIDHYVRQGDAWLLQTFEGSAAVPIASIGCGLPLDDVYARTAL